MQIHKIVGGCSSRTVFANETFQGSHYFTESMAYFSSVKMRSGDSIDPQRDAIRDADYFDRYNQGCDVQDTLLRDMLTGRATHAENGSSSGPSAAST